MDQRKKQEEKGEDIEGISKWDCGSPLYDSYELVTLSHHIDKHLMTLPNLGITQFSDHTSSVVPSATVSRLEVCDPRKAKWSSMVSFFSKLVGKNVLKKKNEEIKGKKPKKGKSGIYRIASCTK